MDVTITSFSRHMPAGKKSTLQSNRKLQTFNSLKKMAVKQHGNVATDQRFCEVRFRHRGSDHVNLRVKNKECIYI